MSHSHPTWQGNRPYPPQPTPPESPPDNANPSQPQGYQPATPYPFQHVQPYAGMPHGPIPYCSPQWPYPATYYAQPVPAHGGQDVAALYRQFGTLEAELQRSKDEIAELKTVNRYLQQQIVARDAGEVGKADVPGGALVEHVARNEHPVVPPTGQTQQTSASDPRVYDRSFEDNWCGSNQAPSSPAFDHSSESEYESAAEHAHDYTENDAVPTAAAASVSTKPGAHLGDPVKRPPRPTEFLPGGEDDWSPSDTTSGPKLVFKRFFDIPAENEPEPDPVKRQGPPKSRVRRAGPLQEIPLPDHDRATPKRPGLASIHATSELAETPTRSDSTPRPRAPSDYPQYGNVRRPRTPRGGRQPHPGQRQRKYTDFDKPTPGWYQSIRSPAKDNRTLPSYADQYENADEGGGKSLKSTNVPWVRFGEDMYSDPTPAAGITRQLEGKPASPAAVSQSLGDRPAAPAGIPLPLEDKPATSATVHQNAENKPDKPAGNPVPLEDKPAPSVVLPKTIEDKPASTAAAPQTLQQQPAPERKADLGIDNVKKVRFEEGLLNQSKKDKKDTRTVTIDRLPIKSEDTFRDVMDQVRGGPLVSAKCIDTRRINGGSTISLEFVHSKDAIALAEHTATNGFFFQGNPARVTLGATPTPIDSVTARLIRSGASRSVVIGGLPAEWFGTDKFSDLLGLNAGLNAPKLQDWYGDEADNSITVVFEEIKAAGKACEILTREPALIGCPVGYERDPSDRPLGPPRIPDDYRSPKLEASASQGSEPTKSLAVVAEDATAGEEECNDKKDAGAETVAVSTPTIDSGFESSEKTDRSSNEQIDKFPKLDSDTTKSVEIPVVKQATEATSVSSAERSDAHASSPKLDSDTTKSVGTPALDQPTEAVSAPSERPSDAHASSPPQAAAVAQFAHADTDKSPPLASDLTKSIDVAALEKPTEVPGTPSVGHSDAHAKSPPQSVVTTQLAPANIDNGPVVTEDEILDQRALSELLARTAGTPANVFDAAKKWDLVKDVSRKLQDAIAAQEGSSSNMDDKMAKGIPVGAVGDDTMGETGYTNEGGFDYADVEATTPSGIV
ncbi:hypothetical protein K490DRAFT_62186 [Saccharata proteae CBS 121410]|uniref:Uncharacterized protein n=1 Tax=Saccharata proteae CBS 121410 TaxID=1314787 RepID=A0A9P4I2U9_9PEZI|nr:hypothetical protein K490DRAFT_62186 [Saccharata proteae CBS 121410]